MSNKREEERGCGTRHQGRQGGVGAARIQATTSGSVTRAIEEALTCASRVRSRPPPSRGGTFDFDAHS